MNWYFLIAGCLCFLLGIVHSTLGEVLIFKNKRTKGSLVPSIGSIDLKERYIRIIWATWHLASIFGWCLGAILIKISFDQRDLNSNFIEFIVHSMTYSMLLTSLLVLIGTKGKHPGWIVLLTISILLWIGY